MHIHIHVMVTLQESKNITADSVSVPDTGLVFNVIISVDRNDIQGERKNPCYSWNDCYGRNKNRGA